MTSQTDAGPGSGGADAGPGAAGHLPERPGWTCAECGTAWPCPAKRSGLLDEYVGTGAALGIYLGACLVRAMGDLDQLPVAELRHQFLGWLPRAGTRRTG
ncbi:hypothetical protein V6U90_26810 [Micromonospora sp. CPCC 206060]|uniref:hypothetical protein n=1 Tax=Micromonospora sp. CPCC 206060 TaxID=3122406 RepID=UPI002FEF0B6C